MRQCSAIKQNWNSQLNLFWKNINIWKARLLPMLENFEDPVVETAQVGYEMEICRSRWQNQRLPSACHGHFRYFKVTPLLVWSKKVGTLFCRVVNKCVHLEYRVKNFPKNWQLYNFYHNCTFFKLCNLKKKKKNYCPQG